MTYDADEERPRPMIVDTFDVAIRPVTRPLVPARSVLALMIVLMVLTALPALLGRRIGTTPPFGPTRNGRIVWAIDGDIVSGDPTTGMTRVVIAGPGTDRNPIYSPDGSRIAFLRQIPTDQGRFDIFVSDADGASPVMVSAVPMPMPNAVEWLPDGHALLVDDADGRLLRYSIHGAPARLVGDGVRLEPGAARPPDGAELLYERTADPGSLYVMARDGSRPRQLVGPTADACACRLAGPARWSPDGQMIAFAVRLDGIDSRIFVMNADGTGLHRLTDEDGPWIEADPAWSSAGDRIAFNRWHDDAGAAEIRPIGIVGVAGGDVQSIGVAPAADGALIEWSPDGRSILSLPKTLIDAYISYPNGTGSVARPVILGVDDGSSRLLDWSVGSVASWQRQAP